MTKVSPLIPAILLLCICRFQVESNRRVINFFRERRHLLFPDPKESETIYQMDEMMDDGEIIVVITFLVLFGLGLPMEGEVSTILGYVLKCNYDLPYNASDFMQQWRSRLKRSENDFALSRTTMSEGYMTRWALYGMLESTMERFGSGKACLLRVVCESAAYPFDKGHGLLGELLHVLLTPSTTSEEYEIYSNREYHAAEAIGRSTRGRCAPFYPECEYNPLDYFTRLHV